MTNNPAISVIVPAYNVAATIAETLDSILRQTFQDFELIIVDDGSKDKTSEIIADYASRDKRIRVFRQQNRGLAGARNTGIHLSRARFLAFCDADDIWEPEKMELHLSHLEQNPHVGISFCGSSLINEAGQKLAVSQLPKLHNIAAADIFKRNPIGNGSVAVFRREALDCLAHRPSHETERDWWFDETLRQSEDIDAWLRFILTSDWKIEGVQGLLTRYRVQPGGLSANLTRQFETWCRVRDKVAALAPDFCSRVAPSAEAYQLRYLARRAVASGDGALAADLARRSLLKSYHPLVEEPVKTLSTWLAAEVLNLMGGSFHRIVTRNLAPKTA